MQEKSTLPRCRISTLFAEASLVKVFQSLGDGEASQIPEGPCSLKSLEFNKVAALGFSDGRLYKMAGNAVSVPVVSALGRRLKEIDAANATETGERYE